MTHLYWVHLPNQNIKTEGYIGISIEPIRRWKNYKKRSTNCTHFKNAIEKYSDTLVWEIIFSGSEEGASQLEEYFRPTPGIGWNIAQGGRKSTMLNRTHSEETRTKMSKAGKGRSKSESHKSAISKANKGKPGFMGDTNPRARSIRCIELNRVFTTIKAASEFISRNSTTIITALRNPTKTAGGYSWEYVT